MSTEPQDPKFEALLKHGTLHPRPQDVKDEIFRESSRFFDRRDLVQVKYEMLRKVSKDGQPVGDVAKSFGVSRPTFYKTQQDFNQEGLAGLIPRKRGPRSAHKLNDQVMEVIEGRLQEQEADASALAELVEERFGLAVHPRSIERALERRKKKR